MQTNTHHHTADSELDLAGQRAWAVAQAGEEWSDMACDTPACYYAESWGEVLPMWETTRILSRWDLLRREAARIARLMRDEGG